VLQRSLDTDQNFANALKKLVSTNHQRGGDLDSPNRCVRFDFLHDSSQRQFGGLSEKSVEDLLAGAAQADATFQSMVFEPANRVIYLATGANATSHPFTRINLSPYFSEPKLSGPASIKHL